MTLPEGLASPPSEYGPMPFWFWNDDLDETELLRQIEDFQRHGAGGFVIHPRVGLPRRLAWMSEDLLSFYRVAIEEARRRRMAVMLYDEGMYPSGSSSGQVVASNPAFACRCLAKIDLVDGKPPLLSPGENPVAVLLRKNGSRMAVIDRPADSVIRGLHYIGEGPKEDEPPAADILNPHAVDAFIGLVYQRFYGHFREYFGNTVMAIFTDEPGLLGRCRERGVFPGTTGIMDHVNRILGYDFTPHLPALWYDDEEDAMRLRREYERALNLRLEETYYRRLSDWCGSRGIALAGHPHKGDDIGPLRYFHIPGQDAVWRWILPDQASALEGPESTQAKCASSAMIHHGRRRNANECCGAYGHELTWDEMNWLVRWGFARGLNLLIPHAFYYSVRGPRRDERPPDVGPNSPWWDRFPEFALSVKRLSWLNTDSVHVCSLAILGQADWLPWKSAGICYRHQRDFNYLEERDILSNARIDGTAIRISGMRYEALILEHDPPPAVMETLSPMTDSGGCIEFDPNMPEDTLIDRLDARIPAEVRVTPPCPALRLRRIRKGGVDYLMIFNEERRGLDFAIEAAGIHSCSLFDPVTGESEPHDPGRPMHLGGHELKVLAFTG